MGLNIMGFATSIKTDDLTEIAKKINIKVSEQFGTWTLEEAMSDIEDDEMCIAKTENGSIILVGNNFPILETKLLPLSANGNKVLRFMFGETSMIFVFEYQKDGKSLRIKSVHNYEVQLEKGKAFDIEYSGIETDEVIIELMQQVSGDDIYTLEPDHQCVRYRYLGKIEDVKKSLTTNENKEIVKNNSSELQAHFDRNEKMWAIWQERGVNSETELTVNFHFYAAKKKNMELLCAELKSDNIEFRVEETRTLVFLKGWKITADIKRKWTLPELQGKTGNLFILSKQTGVSLEGCGAFMPN